MYKSITIDGKKIRRLVSEGKTIWEESQNIPYKGKGTVRFVTPNGSGNLVIFALAPKMPRQDSELGVYRDIKLNDQVHGSLPTAMLDTGRIGIVFPDTITHISVGQTYDIELD